jgi:hypothetical protein
VDPGIYCTTRRCILVPCLQVFGETRDPSFSPKLVPADFFLLPKNADAIKGTRFKTASSIQRTDERTEGGTGRSVLY